VPVSRLTSASSQKYSSSHSMRQHINELVVTDGEQIICVPPQQDIQLAASLGSEKSHALAMFQALTGCDTASVLNLLDMDRKLHERPIHSRSWVLLEVWSNVVHHQSRSTPIYLKKECRILDKWPQR